MLIGSGVLYVCFADSTLQEWNGHSTRATDKELQLLNQEFKDKDIKKPSLDDKNDSLNLKI